MPFSIGIRMSATVCSDLTGWVLDIKRWKWVRSETNHPSEIRGDRLGTRI